MSEQGEQGDTGERGPTGDTGQTGTTGFTGATGRPGLVGITGVSGERGPTGDHGQRGDMGQTGETGSTGARGRQGVPGRSLSRTQTLVLVGFVFAAFLALAVLLQVQQTRLSAQQKVIQANTDNIIRTRIESCHAGVAYIQRLNAQYDALIVIEKSLADDPTASELGIRVAKARIKAYEHFKTPIPPNACR